MYLCAGMGIFWQGAGWQVSEKIGRERKGDAVHLDEQEFGNSVQGNMIETNSDTYQGAVAALQAP